MINYINSHESTSYKYQVIQVPGLVFVHVVFRSRISSISEVLVFVSLFHSAHLMPASPYITPTAPGGFGFAFSYIPLFASRS